MNGWCPEKWNLKQKEAEQRKSIKKSYFQQEKRYWKVGIRLFVKEKLTERTTILRATRQMYTPNAEGRTRKKKNLFLDIFRVILALLKFRLRYSFFVAMRFIQKWPVFGLSSSFVVERTLFFLRGLKLVIFLPHFPFLFYRATVP